MMKITDFELKKHFEKGWYIVHFDTEFTKNMANNNVMKKDDVIKLLEDYLEGKNG